MTTDCLPHHRPLRWCVRRCVSGTCPKSTFYTWPCVRWIVARGAPGGAFLKGVAVSPGNALLFTIRNGGEAARDPGRPSHIQTRSPAPASFVIRWRRVAGRFRRGTRGMRGDAHARPGRRYLLPSLDVWRGSVALRADRARVCPSSNASNQNNRCLSAVVIVGRILMSHCTPRGS